jgi:hypothetical protein
MGTSFGEGDGRDSMEATDAASVCHSFGEVGGGMAGATGM